MGLLLRRSLVVLLLAFICIDSLPKLEAQPSARALDALLQDYAYRAFARPRTGIVYDGDVPSNLTGISVSAMRLRSGSLWFRGVDTYKEFKIPKGVLEQPYVERLVLVYQNLGNWSGIFYPLLNYTYLAPVLGLLAYDASDLTAKSLPELEITAAPQRPISIVFSDVKRVPSYGSISPKCVSFDLNGLVNFSEVVSDTCSTYQQGHFSIVIESSAIPPSPPPGEAPSEGPVTPMPSGRRKKKNTVVWIIVGSVLGGLLLLILLGFLVCWVQKYKNRKKREGMEKASEVGEALNMTTVGSVKAPAATGTRTQPSIESEYVP